MVKLAYLDCPTGIAGDMCLGALVDAGVPLDYLVNQLGRLGISDEYQLWVEAVQRNGQRATKVHVNLTTDYPLSSSAPPSPAMTMPMLRLISLAIAMRLLRNTVIPIAIVTVIVIAIPMATVMATTSTMGKTIALPLPAALPQPIGLSLWLTALLHLALNLNNQVTYIIMASLVFYRILKR